MTTTKTLEFKRSLPLAPARLWPLLTDARHREVWGAPEEGMTMTADIVDTQEGGYERHRCGAAEAPDFLIDTRWYKLLAPDLAAFTETLVVGDETHFTSLVTYDVAANGAGSDLTVTVAVSAFTGPEAFEEIEQGWNGGLANLETLAASQVASA